LLEAIINVGRDREIVEVQILGALAEVLPLIRESLSK
jgi:hypothetical protein